MTVREFISQNYDPDMEILVWDDQYELSLLYRAPKPEWVEFWNGFYYPAYADKGTLGTKKKALVIR